MKMQLSVNDLTYEAEYRDEDVRAVFEPMLRRWSELARARGRRAVVLLAAPPGTGKTTLALFLEQLSRTFDGCAQVQALAMDGFHYPNSYLDTHTVDEGGAPVVLRARKGAHFTFDCAALAAAIRGLTAKRPAPWPAYSRAIHDVVPAAVPVTGEVVLVEGNYLLLDAPSWRDLSAYADETVFLAADESQLRERLVGRKVRGGMARDEAETWYEASDGRNIAQVLGHRLPADVELALRPDGSIEQTPSGA